MGSVLRDGPERDVLFRNYACVERGPSAADKHSKLFLSLADATREADPISLAKLGLTG